MDGRSRKAALVALAGLLLIAIVGARVGAVGAGGIPAAGAFLVLLVALAAVLMLIARPARAAPRREAAAEVPVTPVPPPLVIPKDDKSGPYNACMECGSLKLKPLFLAGALFPDNWRCERCGHKGQCIILPTAVDYQRFLQGLAEEKERTGSE